MGDPILEKITEKAKTTGGMAQVVEHQPSKCKTMNSNPRITKINK
jgi:hypothetical protein